MSYNFLELTNGVCRRLNEVELTSSNFTTETGIYSDIRSYINNSVNRINRQSFEWPFNHVSYTETLVANQSNYAYQSDVKSVAFDTFRLKGDDALNVKSIKLENLDYEEYLEKYTDYEFNPSDYADTPRMVVRNRDLSYTVAPPPDQAYEVKYEYYTFPTNMTSWDDVPTIPEQFEWVIIEGAMYYAYMFRGAVEEAAVSNKLFEEGISDMRKLYINRTPYVRSTVVKS